MAEQKIGNPAVVGLAGFGQHTTASPSIVANRALRLARPQRCAEVFEAWFGDLFDELFSTRH